jgi:hypothetical protein
MVNVLRRRNSHAFLGTPAKASEHGFAHILKSG